MKREITDEEAYCTCEDGGAWACRVHSEEVVLPKGDGIEIHTRAWTNFRASLWATYPLEAEPEPEWRREYLAEWKDDE